MIWLKISETFAKKSRKIILKETLKFTTFYYLMVYSLIFIRSTRLNNLLFGRNFTRIFNFTTTGNEPLKWHSEHLNRAETVKDSFEAAQASERRRHKRSVGCNVIVLHRNNLKWFKVQTACSSHCDVQEEKCSSEAVKRKCTLQLLRWVQHDLSRRAAAEFYWVNIYSTR